MKYEVQTLFIFSGTVTIEANSPAQAKDFINTHYKNMATRERQIFSKSENVWDFDVHCREIKCKARKKKA